MIRESLTAGSRHATMVISAGRGYAFQRRPETAGASLQTAGSWFSPPGWVRLVRTGNLFEAYQSLNGTVWVKIGSDTVPMGATVYVGLAATSHAPVSPTTVLIDGFSVVAKASPSNQPPAVSVTHPTAQSESTAPVSVTIEAVATDPEGRLSAVDFYVDSTLIGRDDSAPYATLWTTSTPGRYSLTAVAMDADGGTTTSGAVPVIIAAPNQPPIASLTGPGHGTSFSAPATIDVTANASDAEGQLTRVEFYTGTTLLGTDTTPPYTFSWTGVPAGTHSLTAVAYDSAGASATTAAVTVTVNNALSAPRLIVFGASADHQANVTRYVFEVFATGADPDAAPAVASADLGKPAPDANNEITSEQATLLNNLAAGSYIATVTAIGPGGSTRSAAVAFTR